MENKKQASDELKHLVRYYHQASHEFFDDVSSDLKERLEQFYSDLEKEKYSVEDIKKMIDELKQFESNLKAKLESLSFLTEKMNQIYQDYK